jgi:hypothetical protein
LVAHQDLMPADVLLEHPHGWVSALLATFDGGQYSHASIYDGSRVVEMDVPGIVTRSLDEFAGARSNVDVFRFASDDGHQLGSSSYPFEPILGRIRYYLKLGPRLAWGTFPILAGFTLVRRISRSAPTLRATLDRLGMPFACLVATGRNAVTCTEFVYRCFAEAGERYDLRIESPGQAGGRSLQPSDAPATRAIRRSLRPRHGTILVAPRQLGGQVTGLHAAAYLSEPAFVTAADLSRTPNLARIGRLSISREGAESCGTFELDHRGVLPPIDR